MSDNKDPRILSPAERLKVRQQMKDAKTREEYFAAKQRILDHIEGLRADPQPNQVALQFGEFKEIGPENCPTFLRPIFVMLKMLRELPLGVALQMIREFYFKSPKQREEELNEDKKNEKYYR
ncbi:MAG: hypothetical protein AAGA83_00210 [Cyanobacteria bacterium P01_F01_bin.116]